MVTKNNPGNRMGTLRVYCPKCNKTEKDFNELQIVKKYGAGPKGKFYCCKNCDFEARFTKGCYVEYEHRWAKGR